MTDFKLGTSLVIKPENATDTNTRRWAASSWLHPNCHIFQLLLAYYFIMIIWVELHMSYDHRMLYWTDRSNKTGPAICRSSVVNPARETLVSGGLNLPNALTIDFTGNELHDTGILSHRYHHRLRSFTFPDIWCLGVFWPSMTLYKSKNLIWCKSITPNNKVSSRTEVRHNTFWNLGDILNLIPTP